MKNCLKHTLQCQNVIFEIPVGSQWYPNQYCESPLSVMYTSWYGQSPNIKTEKHPCRYPFYTLEGM